VSNKEHSYHNCPQPARAPKGLSLEQAHILRQDNAILTLQQSVRQISRQLEQMATHFTNFRGDGQAPEPIHEDENDNSSDSSLRGHSRRGGRRPPRDDFRDIKVDPLEFNGNPNPDEYLELVQALDRIFEANGYDDVKSFKIASIKLIRYASLWFENLKKQKGYR